ncbi:MAG: hypothetical protein C0618_09590 [Desulfuromonas sp.]|nr:MAG: hypothetical protein C0618_09590 [Desulfuromonas sp.]
MRAQPLRCVVGLVACSFLVLCCFSSALASEEKGYRGSFTTLGVGVETVTYQEKTRLRDGNPVETDTTLVNVVQRSAGYTGVSERFGFYLETLSSLSTGTDQEEWDHSVAGIIQTNEMKVQTSEFNLLGAYHVRPGHMVTAGLDVFSLNFTRSDVRTSNQVQNAALGAVSEDSFSFVAELGYRYDSSFVRPKQSLGYHLGAKASFPIFYKVYNSGSAELQRQVDASGNYIYQTGHNAADGHVDADGYLTDGVYEEDHYVTEIVHSDPVDLEKFGGGGYGLGADAGVTWRLNDKFSLHASVEFVHKWRDELKENNYTLPEVTVTIVRGLGGLVWNF